MIAVRPGGLTQVDAPPAQGGGLYLSQGVQSRRIWCTGAGADCHIGLAIEVSPDGCRIAFDAKPPGAAAGLAADGTVQVLTLCTPPDAARAKRR
jgi:hypothetical protein